MGGAITGSSWMVTVGFTETYPRVLSFGGPPALLTCWMPCSRLQQDIGL